MPAEEAPARVQDQLDRAYRQMAGFYRPAAPGDGLGNITADPRELDLDAENSAYARGWWAEENNGSFHVGSRLSYGADGGSIPSGFPAAVMMRRFSARKAVPVDSRAGDQAGDTATVLTHADWPGPSIVAGTGTGEVTLRAAAARYRSPRTAP